MAGICRDEDVASVLIGNRLRIGTAAVMDAMAYGKHVMPL